MQGPSTVEKGEKKDVCWAYDFALSLRFQLLCHLKILICSILENMIFCCHGGYDGEGDRSVIKKVHIAVLSQEVGGGKTWHIIYSGKRDRGTNVRMDLLDTWVLEL